MVSPVSKPYFVAAIMESGSCDSAEFFVSMPRANDFASVVLDKVKCSPELSNAALLACLRDVRVEDLFMTTRKDWDVLPNATIPPLAPLMPWGPVIDGVSEGLLDRPSRLIAAGNFNRVPLIIGTNLNEGSIFVPFVSDIVPGARFPLNDAHFQLVMLHFFNTSAAAAVSNFYPLQNYKNNDERTAFILRDYLFLCGSRKVARSISSFGVPVYLYQFTHDLKGWPEYKLFGDYHTSELDFVFDNAWPIGVHRFTEDDKKMASTFGMYWSNLAKGKDPNYSLDPNALYWPKYSTSVDSNMNLRVPTNITTGLNKDACDFFANVYPWYY